MAELKTQPTDVPVEDFLNSLEDAKKREDCRVLSQIMEKATGAKGLMWGESIVGFGQYRYKYASGRTGDWPLVGYSPRKQNLTLYLISGFADYDDLLKRLGKYKTSVACLYLKKLADIDLDVLQELINKSVEHMRRIYPVAAE